MPVPNAKSASVDEDDELLNEKKPLDFLLLGFFRFLEGAVKKEVKPPATDFRAGAEESECEESDDDDDDHLLLLHFFGEWLRRYDFDAA